LLQMLPGLEKNGGFGADVGVRLLGGGLSGITAASMTYPLDLVRTRLAAQVRYCYQCWIKFCKNYSKMFRCKINLIGKIDIHLICRYTS
jgi:hypothetical protein